MNKKETKPCICGENAVPTAVDFTEKRKQILTWQCMKCGHIIRNNNYDRT